MIRLFPFQGIVAASLEGCKKSSYYLYQIEKNSSLITGLVCALPIAAAEEGGILRHEQTLPDHTYALSADFAKSHIQRTPVLLIANPLSFQQTMANLSSKKSVIGEKAGAGGTTHRLLRVEAQEQARGMISHSSPLCLGDGHHRLEALGIYYKDRPRISIGRSAILAAIFSTESVTTRSKAIIVTIPYLEQNSFWANMRAFFEVFHLENPLLPSRADEFLMRFCNKWYFLRLHGGLITEQTEKLLSIEAFKLYVLKAVFRQLNYSSNPHVKVLFDTCNLTSVSEFANDPLTIGFVLANDQAEQVWKLAKDGRVLESRSTYFEPKLLSDMVSLPLKTPLETTF